MKKMLPFPLGRTVSIKFTVVGDGLWFSASSELNLVAEALKALPSVSSKELVGAGY
jgi:hypothetical protein